MPTEAALETSTSPSTAAPHVELAVSRELVEAMEGSTKGRRELSRGSTVTLLLPADAPAVVELAAESPASSQVLGRASVMIVDDDPLMCELLSAMLEESYEVESFTSARLGIAALDRGGFDLIVCDLMMPELNGMDLHAHLVDEHPGLLDRLVFMSGGAFTERGRIFLEQTDRPVLQKPFARGALVHALERTLAGAALEPSRVELS